MDAGLGKMREMIRALEPQRMAVAGALFV